MKWIEISVGFFYCLFVVLAALHFPGGESLSCFWLFVSAIFYAIFSFLLFAVKGEAGIQNEPVLSVFAGFAFSITLIGSLFRQMFWPGYSIFLLLGLVAILVICLSSWTKWNKKILPEYHKRMLIRGMLISGIGLVWFFLPQSVLIAHDQKLRRIHYANKRNSGLSTEELSVTDSLKKCYLCQFYPYKTNEPTSKGQFIVELDNCTGMNKDSLDQYAYQIAQSYSRVIPNKGDLRNIQVVFTQNNPNLSLTENKIATCPLEEAMP